MYRFCAQQAQKHTLLSNCSSEHPSGSTKRMLYNSSLHDRAFSGTECSMPSPRHTARILTRLAARCFSIARWAVSLSTIFGIAAIRDVRTVHQRLRARLVAQLLNMLQHSWILADVEKTLSTIRGAKVQLCSCGLRTHPKLHMSSQQ
jgi:hypothetical protein